MCIRDRVLFVIEPTLYENSVKQAEAELKTAKANLEYAVSSYPVSYTHLDFFDERMDSKRNSLS